MENVPLPGNVMQGILTASQTSKGPDPPTHTDRRHAAVAFSVVQGHAHEHILLPGPH